MGGPGQMSQNSSKSGGVSLAKSKQKTMKLGGRRGSKQKESSERALGLNHPDLA